MQQLLIEPENTYLHIHLQQARRSERPVLGQQLGTLVRLSTCHERREQTHDAFLYGCNRPARHEVRHDKHIRDLRLTRYCRASPTNDSQVNVPLLGHNQTPVHQSMRTTHIVEHTDCAAAQLVPSVHMHKSSCARRNGL